jgi:hypothetical protein
MSYVFTPISEVVYSPISPLYVTSDYSPVYNPVVPNYQYNSLVSGAPVYNYSSLVNTPINTSVFTPVYDSVVNTTVLTPTLVNTSLDNLYGPSYVTSVNLNYSKPLVSIYQDLNTDPRIHKRMIKYFQMKTLDKWLMNDLVDILNYFKINSNGAVDIINNINEYKPNNSDSAANAEKKIDFIHKYFLTASVIDRLLDRYVKDYNIQWVHLPRNEYQIKKLIASKLMKLIKAAISSKSNK